MLKMNDTDVVTSLGLLMLVGDDDDGWDRNDDAEGRKGGGERAA